MDVEQNKLDVSHLDSSIDNNNCTSAPSVTNNGNVQGNVDTQPDEKIRKKRKTRRFRKRAKGLANKPYSRPFINDSSSDNTYTSRNNTSTNNTSTNTGTSEKKKRRRHKSKYHKIRYVYPQPEAPCNTNEFLLQDHKEFEGTPNIIESDENYDMTWEEKDEELFEQNYTMFSEVSALSQLSPRQLVDKVLFLNSKLLDYQNELKKRSDTNSKDNVQLLEDISRLEEENQRLKEENDELKRQLENETTTSSSPIGSEADTKEGSSDILLEPK